MFIKFIHERARAFLQLVEKFYQQKGESGSRVKPKMLQIDPTRVKEDIEDRLRTEEDSVNWLRDKMKQSMELTSTMTGESKFF